MGDWLSRVSIKILLWKQRLQNPITISPRGKILPPPSMASSTSSPLPILKIGFVGFGPFAQFLAKTMIKQGHSVTATSRSDYSQLCSQMGITFFREMKEFCEVGSDVLLLCPSILSFSEVLKSIPFNSLEKKTLFVDVLSVKEYPKQVLSLELPENFDVLCTHPMFGAESGKESWEGLPLVFDKVRIRDEVLCRNFLWIFEKEGCRMVEMSCEEHDMLAGQSQFLTHTIGRILSEMEIKSTSMDTKNFETLLQLKESTMNNSFDLYCGLFKHNKFAKQELDKLELAFRTVKRKLLETIEGK
ncbi:arogenate dehydrogenase 2, chloroplastic-like isoform X1 [Tasmannia lanceolata]|uniref:arogenate dehydrogenase 2, chloroplastic-like isoform X1 n=1 Tax=Tasmannia lanceolata TaxID=3420 RepID=UPI004062CDBA